MAEQRASRRLAVLLVVLGVIAVGLGSMLLIGVLQGDDTEHIDPQNGRVIRIIEWPLAQAFGPSRLG